MNIKSKRYKIQTGYGASSAVEIRDMVNNQSCWVRITELPSLNELALMHEKTFDNICAGFIS
jgi:hypothetical protein